MRPESEFSACKMNDVVLFEKTETFNPMAIDVGPVAAVFVDEPKLARNVSRQCGVKAAQAKVGDHEIVSLAAPDPTRQLGDDEFDPTTISVE